MAHVAGRYILVRGNMVEAMDRAEAGYCLRGVRNARLGKLPYA
jgi:hypothetical protein